MGGASPSLDSLSLSERFSRLVYRAAPGHAPPAPPATATVRRVISHDEARSFAAGWQAAWNSRDVEGVLAHFADDCVFSSPVAAEVVPGSGGVIRGKDALRDYWNTALERVPDLHFDVLAVYAGVDSVVINYRHQNGGLVCEVLTLEDGLVVAGRGTYLEDAAVLDED
jgi:ketosteroid isomerase-like protein